MNPSDCVDMDCDGAKKVLLKDLDGSLLGTPLPVAIFSHSEFEWDGDRRRGVGNYRIPKHMLVDVNGNKLNVKDVAPRKGTWKSLPSILAVLFFICTMGGI